uniref:protein FAM78A-like n=1 Tax=Myxine glutinosa TaxID=7769 RepID=UPI0035900234
MNCCRLFRKKEDNGWIEKEDRPQVKEIRAWMESRETELDESDPVVLRYRSPHFFAKAKIMVPSTKTGHAWTVGWLQVCTHMLLNHMYGKHGRASWELPNLAHGPVSDSDGCFMPWYGSSDEVTTVLGASSRREVEVSMDDNFCPSVSWAAPRPPPASPGGPSLKAVLRDQVFITWLAAHHGPSHRVIALAQVDWHACLRISVNARAPLGHRARLLPPRRLSPPSVSIPPRMCSIPPSALQLPVANDAQVLMWYPRGGQPVMVIPPKS